jgi:hypothetical protein
MDYEANLVRDFAIRTRKNLEFIEEQQKQGVEIYEVTQLVNSLLGLLIFPHERYYDSIPRTPLTELEAQGWPRIEIIKGQSECQTLYNLVHFLRNGIAHFNIQFLPDQDGQLDGLRIWNQNPRTNQKTWEARLYIHQLRKITEVFIDCIQSSFHANNDTQVQIQ